MSPSSFAERQYKLFRSGKNRLDAYHKQWDTLESRIRTTYERLADELAKCFTNNSFLILSSRDARMCSEYLFVQFSIFRMKNGYESALPGDTVLLFVQGLYGEVTVAFHKYKLREAKDHIYRVYARPDKISEKELEKILSGFFEYIAGQSRLNKPSYWAWLKDIKSRLDNSRKILVYNKSPLIVLKSMTNHPAW